MFLELDCVCDIVACFQHHLESLEEDAIERHRRALAVKRSEKPKKLRDECGKYWSEILSQQYHFARGACVHRKGIILSDVCSAHRRQSCSCSDKFNPLQEGKANDQKRVAIAAKVKSKLGGFILKAYENVQRYYVGHIFIQTIHFGLYAWNVFSLLQAQNSYLLLGHGHSLHWVYHFE